MKCNEARQRWNLYHDSEGDVQLHFRIEQHLEDCPDCTEWFRQQSRLEGLLVAKLAAPAPAAELWNRVLGGSGLKKSVGARRRMLVFGAAAACAAAVALFVWSGRQLFQDIFQDTENDLAGLTSSWHERLTAGAEPMQFLSDSDLEVEDYLRRQVTFPVRCPPRKDTGFAVAGAGVCRFADQPAAYLSGHVDRTPVSIFVMPRASLAAFPRHRDTPQGRIIHHRAGSLESVFGVIDRNAVLVVGRTNPAALERVLHAYGTYPDHH